MVGGISVFLAKDEIWSVLPLCFFFSVWSESKLEMQRVKAREARSIPKGAFSKDIIVTWTQNPLKWPLNYPLSNKYYVYLPSSFTENFQEILFLWEFYKFSKFDKDWKFYKFYNALFTHFTLKNFSKFRILIFKAFMASVIKLIVKLVSHEKLINQNFLQYFSPEGIQKSQLPHQKNSLIINFSRENINTKKYVKKRDFVIWRLNLR